MNEGLLIFILIFGAIIEIAFLVVFFRMAANISKIANRECSYASIKMLIYLGEKERAKEFVLASLKRHTDEFYGDNIPINEKNLSYFKSELKKHIGREMELVGLDIDKIPDTIETSNSVTSETFDNEQ